jgi:hypothetical protein
MNPFALVVLIAIGAVVLGAGLIFASVRRAGWYRRVVPWLGVAAGVLALGFGALAGVVAVTVGPDGEFSWAAIWRLAHPDHRTRALTNAMTT